MMKVLITDHAFANAEPERTVLEATGVTLQIAQCKTPGEILEVARDADALLVQFAPVTAEVIAGLDKAKVIVRYGIGMDNVDIAAACLKGIPACNVPDYGIDEVADHSMALALSLARQLPFLDASLRAGTANIFPDRPMPAFREMTFATAGFGRIAQAVLRRAAVFGFNLAAYDPYVPDESLAAAGVRRVSEDELFTGSDILSLHLPLNGDTLHFVNAARLSQMKPTAVLVNTARGGLIDTIAITEALNSEVIASAGLDVFEIEPLPQDHPLRSCSRVILTAHTAWYSESSAPKLQRLAAEEVLRALRNEPLRCPVG